MASHDSSTSLYCGAIKAAQLLSAQFGVKILPRTLRAACKTGRVAGWKSGNKDYHFRTSDLGDVLLIGSELASIGCVVSVKTHSANGATIMKLAELLGCVGNHYLRVRMLHDCSEEVKAIGDVVLPAFSTVLEPIQMKAPAYDHD